MCSPQKSQIRSQFQSFCQSNYQLQSTIKSRKKFVIGSYIQSIGEAANLPPSLKASMSPYQRHGQNLSLNANSLPSVYYMLAHCHLYYMQTHYHLYYMLTHYHQYYMLIHTSKLVDCSQFLVSELKQKNYEACVTSGKLNIFFSFFFFFFVSINKH
jgi:hypothetical protein